MTKILHRLFLILLTLSLITSCGQSGPASTTSTSNTTDFKTLSSKTDFLEQYVQFRRTYHALDFYIFFQNNAGGLVPGPNDWDIQLIAKIPKSEISLWTNGMHATTAPKAEWMKKLPTQIPKAGISVWYESGNRLLGIDMPLLSIETHRCNTLASA